MGISQEKLDKLRGIASGSRSAGIGSYFRARLRNGKATKYDIRILPAAGEGDFAVLGRVHYGPNKVQGTCPRHFDEPCAFCDYFEQHFSDHWDKDKFKPTGKGPHFESFRKIGSQGRVYFNVIDFESKEVKIWSLPQDTDQSFGSVMVQQVIDMYGAGIDVLDPVKGRDFKLTLTPRGAAYMYSGDFAERTRKIPKAFDGWQNKLHDLEAVPRQKVLSTSEMQSSIEYFEKKLS